MLFPIFKPNQTGSFVCEAFCHGLLAALLVLWAEACCAQDFGDAWTRFRGPNGSGLNDTQALNVDWANTPAPRWKVELPGAGHSSPVVANDCIFTTSFDSDNLFHILGHRLSDGKQILDWTHPLKPHRMHRLNNVASSTLAADETAIYALLPQTENVELITLSFDGKLQWRRELGPWVAQHGFGVSPIVVDNHVIVLNSQEPQQGMRDPGTSGLLAFDKSSGELIWQTELDGARACYGAPIVDGQGDNRTLLCATAGEGFFGVSSSNGELLWKQPVFQLRVVGSPILAGRQLIGNNGSGGGGNYVVSVDVDAAEHPKQFEIHRTVGYVPTLISVEDKLFSCTDNGLVACFDLSDGTETWSERVSSGFWSSPVSDGKSLFCLDKDGTLYVIEAASTFHTIGTIDLNEPSEATPAIVRGNLIVRTERHLYCFGPAASELKGETDQVRIGDNH
ncbi:MAG: PQQ-binding-like beta-propeller repeat protein [Pirellulaceae bacterium]